MEEPKSELYSLAFYISWKILRKQNPIFEKLREKAKKFAQKELAIELKNPIFARKKMDPDIGNECIAKLRKILENFEHEDKQVKAWMREPFGIENFAVEDRGDHIVGQYKITFQILNKTRMDYGRILPIILKRILKIRIETDKALLSITDYRCTGQVKVNDSVWPANASTDF